MKRTCIPILAGISLIILAACSRKAEKIDFMDTQDSEFKVGQVWNYRTRPTELNSTLTICKVEKVGKLGIVIHVSIADVRLGLGTSIQHMPFTESAVKQSVTQLIKEGVASPNYREGYEEWRNSIEAGKGGVWTIPVAEALAAAESSLK
jgi:hypothetical protein